jgi:hypothetical protein
MPPNGWAYVPAATANATPDATPVTTDKNFFMMNLQ